MDYVKQIRGYQLNLLITIDCLSPLGCIGKYGRRKIIAENSESRAGNCSAFLLLVIFFFEMLAYLQFKRF